ncbi:SRPBCC family protein [Mycolicibacterium stellerae]|uniref:SRPBCC family protein n=1 Tax=Mycolicibacterium stellerae TaxID=2358193 RepID=UPI001F26F843|nr:SRPBCC family protein [Mycolicibacterium stellerae]
MTTTTVRVAAAAALLYAARRYYLNWGTTKAECAMYLPGDELFDGPVIRTTEAVWINAPTNAVWPWLVQMGQDRGGLYSYEALENLVGLDYRNADRIHPEWQRLVPGDRVRLAPKGWAGLRDGFALRVVEVIERQAVVLCAGPPPHPLDAVWSFHVIPHAEDRCRLLVRSRTRRRHWADALGVECAAPAKALVTRGMLRGIKRRAEAPNDVGFPAELGAEGKAPTGDSPGTNADEMLLRR